MINIHSQWNRPTALLKYTYIIASAFPLPSKSNYSNTKQEEVMVHANNIMEIISDFEEKESNFL